MRIKEIIVVEGKDDTAAINRACQAETIETHGFGMAEAMWKKLELGFISSITYTLSTFDANSFNRSPGIGNDRISSEFYDIIKQ